MTEFKKFLWSVAIFGGFTILLTLVFVLIQTTFDKTFTYHISVIPRTGRGLVGILFNCWGHWSWQHWGSNMLGWLGLCPAMLSFGAWPFLLSFGFIQVFGAFFVWLCGSVAAHAGLSGVLCGFFGFLMVSLCLERPFRIRTLVVVLVTAVIYFAMFFASLTSFKEGVSWEGHLFGFLSGLCFAFGFFTKCHEVCQQPVDWIRKKRTNRTRMVDLPTLNSTASAGPAMNPSFGYNETVQPAPSVGLPYGDALSGNYSTSQDPIPNYVVYGKPCK